MGALQKKMKIFVYRFYQIGVTVTTLLGLGIGFPLLAQMDTSIVEITVEGVTVPSNTDPPFGENHKTLLSNWWDRSANSIYSWRPTQFSHHEKNPFDNNTYQGPWTWGQRNLEGSLSLNPGMHERTGRIVQQGILYAFVYHDREGRTYTNDTLPSPHQIPFISTLLPNVAYATSWAADTKSTQPWWCGLWRHRCACNSAKSVAKEKALEILGPIVCSGNLNLAGKIIDPQDKGHYLWAIDPAYKTKTRIGSKDCSLGNDSTVQQDTEQTDTKWKKAIYSDDYVVAKVQLLVVLPKAWQSDTNSGILYKEICVNPSSSPSRTSQAYAASSPAITKGGILAGLRPDLPASQSGPTSQSLGVLSLPSGNGHPEAGTKALAPVSPAEGEGTNEKSLILIQFQNTIGKPLAYTPVSIEGVGEFMTNAQGQVEVAVKAGTTGIQVEIAGQQHLVALEPGTREITVQVGAQEAAQGMESEPGPTPEGTVLEAQPPLRLELTLTPTVARPGQRVAVSLTVANLASDEPMELPASTAELSLPPSLTGQVQAPLAIDLTDTTIESDAIEPVGSASFTVPPDAQPGWHEVTVTVGELKAQARVYVRSAAIQQSPNSAP